MPRKSPPIKPDPPLQPLRIRSGWTVVFNTFFEVEPQFKSFDDTSWNFKEDMLLIDSEQHGVAIDLGWYPSFRASGSFGLVAVALKGDGADWQHPLRRLHTRSKKKVAAAIESWQEWFENHPPRRPIRARKRGQSL